jgi:signal transduction histidine kinase
MHDTLLQGFTGITLQLRALLKSAPKGTHQMHSILEAIEAEATRSVREARRAVGDMRGNEPGTADLVTALQELVQSESSRTSAHLCWKLEGEPRELPGHVAESLFRIGREALSNAIRHANATCVEVSLSIAHNSSLHLRIKDNGSGFEISPELARRQGHWGLVGMQERAERLGGKLQVNSERGHGATISVEIPV